MSEASLQTARGLIQAFNQADWGQLEALLTPDSVYDEVGTGRRAEGGAEIVDLYKGWKRAMPDAEGTVTSAVDGGDAAVLEITWNGTFTGPWGTPQGEIEPTGRHQTSRSCIVPTLEGDSVTDR